MSASTLSTGPEPPASPGPERPAGAPRSHRWILYVVVSLILLMLVALTAMAAWLVFGTEASEEESSAPVVLEPTDDTTTAVTTETDEAAVETTEIESEPASTTEAEANSVATTEAVTTAVPDAECSAEGYASSSDQTGMPDAVVATRAAIFTAAANCDIDGLVELTADAFTASFGGGDPATLWTEAEARGDEPLLFLVRLLDQPYKTLQSEGGEFYVWPSAFLADSWSEVTEAERAGLAVVFSEEEIAEFESFGNYIGYRVAIHESGAWVYFVAGD